MTLTKRKIASTLWAIIVSISFFEIQAQQRFSYSGDYQLRGLNGRAKYEYQVIGIDTLFEGPFIFERSDLSSLLKEKDSSFIIRGGFDENVPQGKWLFQFGDFQSDSTTQLSGFNYKVNIEGTLQEAQGSFVDGKPNGTWQFSEKQIKDSQALDTLFFSEINFSNGVPQLTFRLENGKGALVGRLLRNGLAHDSWSFISNEGDAIENWHFNEGRLLKVEKERNGVFVSTPIFGAEAQASEEENLDRGFIALLKIYNDDDTMSQTQKQGIGAILMQNQLRYHKIKRVLSDLGTNNFGTGFKVLVPYFPLDAESKAQLDSTTRWAKHVKAIGQGYLNSTQLSILRRSDPDANYLYHVTKALDSQFIQPLSQLIAMNDFGVLDNVKPARLVQHLFPNGNPEAEISFHMDDGASGTFIGPNGENANFNGGTIESLYQMAAYVKGCIQQVSASLENKLIDDQKQQEFEELEKRMVEQVDALTDYPDSIQQILNNRQTKALSNIKEFAENLLSTYAEKDSDKKTLDGAKNLVECLGHLDVLSNEVVKLSDNGRLLQEKYTDAVFNPFTATIMDERVKKRITGAYRNIIVPYLLDVTEQKLSCDNAEPLHKLYAQVQERMLELRDEDSAKMERKLRKERNPKAVLDLFNLKPIGK